MLNLFVAGLLAFLVSLFVYRGWTGPKSLGPRTGYALGTIRGTQFGMILGAILMAIGLIGLAIQAIGRLF